MHFHVIVFPVTLLHSFFLSFRWNRWPEITSQSRFRQEVKECDIEAISRTIIAFCFRHYRTDERTKQFYVELIDYSVANAPAKNEKFDITSQILESGPSKGSRGRKRGNSGRNALRRLTHQYSKPALIECGFDWQTIAPEQMIIDAGYRKHLQHHCSKIMGRIRLMHCIQADIIKEASVPIKEGKSYEEIELQVPYVEGDIPAVWWDEAADKSLLIGTYKHGKNYCNNFLLNLIKEKNFGHIFSITKNIFLARTSFQELS